LKTEDISHLRFFANSGEGVAILPQIGIQEDIDRGLVEMIPLSHLANINFHAVYAKGTLKLDYIEKLLE
jgi:DNA-binding transcriptional LysR family regulator